MTRMDYGVFIAVLALLGFGIVLVYSSSFAIAQDKFGGSTVFLARQVTRVLIALVFFVVFINIDYHVWARFSTAGYIGALALLVAVLVMPGSHAVNGARRWLMIGPLQVQVSEVARLALIVLFAARCDELGERISQLGPYLKLLAKAGIVCLLVVVEPNFSMATIIGTLTLSLLFVGGAKFWHVAGVVLAVVPLAAGVMLAAPYRRARVMSYLSMSGGSESAHPGSYQAQQALIGLGNGGLFGVGLGQGKQKLFYLPEPHTDFAFAILGEEIGLVGLLLVLAIFAFVIYRGLRIAVRAPDKMGQMMAFGVTLVMALYVLVHAAVNVGLAPTTGIPLPFLSYGGVSIIITMASTGILLNISSQARVIAPSKSVSGEHPKNPSGTWRRARRHP